MANAIEVKTGKEVNAVKVGNKFQVTFEDGNVKEVAESTFKRWFKVTGEITETEPEATETQNGNNQDDEAKKAAAEAKAKEKAEKAAAKEKAKQEKADAKAKRDQEKADAKVKREVEKAEAKAKREAEKAAKKAEREAAKEAAKVTYPQMVELVSRTTTQDRRSRDVKTVTILKVENMVFGENPGLVHITDYYGHIKEVKVTTESDVELVVSKKASVVDLLTNPEYRDKITVDDEMVNVLRKQIADVRKDSKIDVGLWVSPKLAAATATEQGEPEAQGEPQPTEE